MAKKILIVDDDPVVVKYLENVLNDNGYETCSATGGIDALEKVKSENPDMITLDLEMPDEWGPKFYRRLVKEKAYKDLPVLVVSGMASRHLSIKKAVGFLAKPFDPEKLVSMIREAIGE